LKVLFTRFSKNSKVGPIPVSYTERSSCPDSCELKSNGCYAELGNTGVHWKKYCRLDWSDFCAQVKSLPKNTLWRHNVAGDLPGENLKIDSKLFKKLIESNCGKKGFTYTHKPTNATNKKLIKYANENGFTINLSADNLQQADKLSKLNIAPVVVVLPSDSPTKLKTPEGRNVTVCPAEYADNITCSNCGACAKSSRKIIIGFRAHGVRKESINKRLKVIK